MAMYLLVSSSASTVKEEATETSSSSDMRGYATRQLDTIPQAQDVVSGGERTLGSAYLEALESSMKEAKSKCTALEGKKLAYNGNISLKVSKGQVPPLSDKIKALIKEDSRVYLTSENFYTWIGNNNMDFMYGDIIEELPNNADICRKVMITDLRVASEHFHDIVASIKALVHTNMVLPSFHF